MSVAVFIFHSLSSLFSNLFLPLSVFKVNVTTNLPYLLIKITFEFSQLFIDFAKKVCHNLIKSS